MVWVGAGLVPALKTFRGSYLYGTAYATLIEMVERNAKYELERTRAFSDRVEEGFELIVFPQTGRSIRVQASGASRQVIRANASPLHLDD